ncbi:hypothetical protein EBT31_20145, partial [bacterium]|nr:hypothetical protein [bacterium]
MLSVGGFLGGFFVGVVAPYGFDSNYELSVGIVLSAVVVMLALLSRHGQWPAKARPPLWAAGLALVVGLVVVCVHDHREDNQGVAWKARNFYGALKIYEPSDGTYRSMLHGQIIHGQQFIAPEKQQLPLFVAKPSLRSSEKNAWQATPKEREQALKMFEDDGILPYVSQGFLDLPTEPPKLSLQKFNPEKHLAFDPVLQVPINKNGTVTVYYHTTIDKAKDINNKKVIPSEGRNRIYLTNESGGADVLRDRGNFDQELDGSTVLVYVTPDMLQVDRTYENGRVDFYLPTAQGDFFNKKMKLQSIQKARTQAIVEEFSYDAHEKKITQAIQQYKDASPKEREAMLKDARAVLKREHNVSSLMTENGKLEKTRIGEYELSYDGLPVASQGLGLASAQKISEKISTCPRSAICEGLCLGETSGGNFMFGGAA